MKAPSSAGRYAPLTRLLQAGALLGGAFLLWWIAPHTNPWDMTRLARSGATGPIQVDLWSMRYELPAWIFVTGAIVLGLALVVIVLHGASRLNRVNVVLGLGGIAVLFFSLFPTRKGWEIVTELALGSLGVALLTVGLLGLWPSLIEWILNAKTRATKRLLEMPLGLLLGLVFVFVFLVTNLGSYLLFGHIPHIVDSVDQLIHAKMFVRGHLTVPPPAPADFFQFTHMILDDRWYSQYPPGHTLLLAVGVLLRAPWLINPLFGALSVVLLYFIGREAYGELTGRVSALLGAFSPFLLIMSSSFMNHTTTLFFLELFLLGLVRMICRSGPIDGLLVGLGLGYALTIRSMSAAAVAFPFGVHVMVRLARLWLRGERKVALRLTRAVVVAVLALAVPVSGLLVFNNVTNGDPLLFGYEVLHGKDALPGFGNGGWWGRPHTPQLGLQATLRNLNALNQYLFGLPLPSLLFALVGLAWLRVRVWDFLFMASAASLATAYFFYWYQDWALGPRFLYSALAPLVLMTARALLAFPRFAAGVTTPERAGRLTAGLLLLLSIGYAHGLAVNAPMFAGFYSHNYADGNHKLLNVTGLASENRSIVFVPSFYHPSLFPRNDPLLRGNVIYALDYGFAENKELIALYPGRRAYQLFAFEDYTLVEYGQGEFPYQLIYPIVPGTPLTIEALTFQVSQIRGDRWRDRRTGELGGRWKNHDDLEVMANVPGSEVGFLLRATQPEMRTLRVALSHGPRFGVVQVLYNQKPITSIDLYTERHEVRTHLIGDAQISVGLNSVMLRVEGKNDSSIGYGLGVDYITLE